MDDTLSVIPTSQLSVYFKPEWPPRMARVATISQTADGTYTMDRVPVVATRVIGHFTVLTCADETNHVVLTPFLRLARRLLLAPQEVS